MDGWITCDFASFSIVFQSKGDNECLLHDWQDFRLTFREKVNNESLAASFRNCLCKLHFISSFPACEPYGVIQSYTIGLLGRIIVLSPSKCVVQAWVGPCPNDDSSSIFFVLFCVVFK